MTVHNLTGVIVYSLSTSTFASVPCFPCDPLLKPVIMLAEVDPCPVLHFVSQKLDCSRSVSSATHLHDESFYKFMTQQGQRQNCKFIDNVLVTMYYAHHFKVTATVNRFVFKLVGLSDPLFFLQIFT